MSKTTSPQKDNTIEILAGVETDETLEKKDLVYSDTETKYRDMLIKKLVYARDEREQNHPEFDGMTYTQYYESNRKKDLSYIPPKENKQDIRIVTGTTREKSSTLLSTLLNLDLTPVVNAFDKENMLVAGLGLHTTDLVTKSREIEQYWERKSTIYREFLSQGDVFCEEVYSEEYTPVPTDDGYKAWEPSTSKISEFKAPKFKLEKTYDGCKLKMIKGTKVYLGSTKIEDIEDQDVVAVLNIYSRDAAEAKYGTWERWQYVPDTIDNTIVPSDEGNLYRDWNVTKVPKGQVGELRIYLPKRNRFMVMLNGVMMLPVDYPMQAVSPTGKCPIIQGKNEPISGFAYSKSVPSKTKVDQEILDEFIKLMMEKMRQGSKPAMGHIGKRIINPNVLYSGRISSNMRENQLFPLLPPEARMLTNSDFSFYKLIKESIEEKTVNAVFSGQSPDGATTATEVVQQKQQQMLKLGLTLDGIVNFEKKAVWFRIYNIYANWTKPVDTKVDQTKKAIKEVYRTITADADIDEDEKGYKVFKFTDEEYPDPYEQVKEEEELTKKNGKPSRLVYMNPKELCSLKYMFFVTIIPSDKSESELAKVVFVQNVRESMDMFGPEAHNIDYIKQRYALKIGENFEKWYLPQDEVMRMQNLARDMDALAGQKAKVKVNPPKPKVGEPSMIPEINTM